MSLDARARAAAAELRQATGRSLDTDDLLQRMHRARARRTVVGSGAGVVAVVVLAVLASGALVGGGDGDGPPGKGRRVTVGLPAEFCSQVVVTCLGRRSARLDLETPLTIRFPDTFVPGNVQSTGVDFFRKDVEQTGISVAQSAVPVRYDAEWKRDPAAGATARSMAEWLADRPFLTDTAITRRSTASGRPAWEVSGDFRRGARLPVVKDEVRIAPTFLTGDGGTFGTGPLLVSSYTLIDQPGGGVTVIWSLAYGRVPPDLPGNRVMVDAVLAAL